VLGYLTGASGLGALVGVLFLASRRSVLGLERIIFVASLVFGAGLILFGLSHSIWISMGMTLIAGMGMMVQMAATNTVLQSIVEEDKRGRVMSLFLMAFTGTAPFGSLFGGFMADRVGAAMTLEFGGVACCLAALLFLRALPEVGREIRPVHERQEMIATATAL
jgi:predicted MFS family arabinose efflux permease